jgi:hypothetical protein
MGISPGTYTLNGLLTISGQLTVNTGATTITTNATGNTVGSSINVNGSYTFTWAGSGSTTLTGNPSFSYHGALTNSTGNTLIFASVSNFGYGSNQATLTNNGIMTFNSGCTLAFGYNCNVVNTGTLTFTSTTFSTGGGSPGAYLQNTGKFFATGGSISLSGSVDYITNSLSSTSLFWASGTTINFTNSNTYFTNTNGTVALTNCTLNMNAGNYIQNYGSTALFTTQSGCTFNMGGAAGGIDTYIGNTGTYIDHGSTYAMSGQGANIQNTGSNAKMTLNGTTITTSATNGNTQIINNSNILTADSTTKITLGSHNSAITNSGIFNAGITTSTGASSPCIIDLTAQGTNISNTSTFNLGSTSDIINEGYTSYVTNTSPGVFTLESDQNGSATLGAIPPATGSSGGGTFTGTFNVQRYITGGSTSYRAYRLLASPVNQSSNNQGAGSFNLAYLNTTATVTNANAVVGTTTYHGALTGGKGGPTNGFSVYGKNNPTIYLYNESLPSSNSTFVSGKFEGVTKVTSSNVTVISGTSTASATIPSGNGYLFYFIGDNSDTTWSSATRTPNATTITATGTINQNSANGSSSNTYTNATLWWNSSTTLSYTPGNPGSNSTGNGAGGAGFNLLGNPYPSVIDLKQLWLDNGSPAYVNFYELVDINPNQPYVSYNASTGGVSSNTYSSRYIASGQGFFVQANNTGQSVVFKEDTKVYNTSLLNSTSTIPILLNAQQPAHYQLGTPLKNAAVVQTQTTGDEPTGLHMKLILDDVSFDECGIYFHPSGADTYNPNDAIDLDGVAPKVFLSSFTTDGVRTGINTLANYTKGKRIKLYVKALTDGIYKLNLEDISNIDTINYKVYLIDKKLNDSLDMVHYKTYTFNFAAADTGSFANRFVLALELRPTAPYDLITFTGQKATSAIQLNWNTANEGNFTSFGLEKLGANGKYALIDSLQSNGSGLYNYMDQNPINGNNIYRLAQNDIHGNVTFAGPLNINYNTISVSGMFTIYPNPSKDIINIAVNSGITGSQATPTYMASIYNLSGTVMDSKQVNSNNWTQDVSSYKAGVYILELKTATGNVVGKAKFVKTN